MPYPCFHTHARELGQSGARTVADVIATSVNIMSLIRPHCPYVVVRQSFTERPPSSVFGDQRVGGHGGFRKRASRVGPLENSQGNSEAVPVKSVRGSGCAAPSALPTWDCFAGGRIGPV